MLERARPLPPSWCRSPRPPGGPGRGGARGRRPAAVRELGDGRLRRSAADTPGRLESSHASRPVGPPTRRSQPGEAMAIATGGASRRAPMPSSPSSMLSRMATRSRSHARALGANVRPRGGDVRAGEPSSARGAARPGAARRARGRRNRRSALRAASTRRVLATGTELRPPGESSAGPDLRGELVLLAARSRGGRRRRAPDAGRRRRGRARGRSSAGSSGRACHVRRRLRRPARPRSAGRARARCRGGVLAGRGQAGQAGLLRRARRDARLRPAGEPGVVACRLRALRSPGAARAPGRGRPAAALRAGPARGGRAPERRARRARARADRGPDDGASSHPCPVRSRT